MIFDVGMNETGRDSDVDKWKTSILKVLHIYKDYFKKTQDVKEFLNSLLAIKESH